MDVDTHGKIAVELEQDPVRRDVLGQSRHAAAGGLDDNGKGERKSDGASHFLARHRGIQLMRARRKGGIQKLHRAHPKFSIDYQRHSNENWPCEKRHQSFPASNHECACNSLHLETLQTVRQRIGTLS